MISWGYDTNKWEFRQAFIFRVKNSGRTQESLVGYQKEECENVSANMEVRFGLGSWSVFSLWENLRIKLAFMIEG